MIESIQEAITAAGGAPAVLGALFSAAGGVFLAIGRRREQLQRESLSQSQLTSRELQRTRDGFLEMETMLRSVNERLQTQNDLIRTERDKWHDLYITARDSLSAANARATTFEQQIATMHIEIEGLKRQVQALQHQPRRGTGPEMEETRI